MNQGVAVLLNIHVNTRNICVLRTRSARGGRFWEIGVLLMANVFQTAVYVHVVGQHVLTNVVTPICAKNYMVVFKRT